MTEQELRKLIQTIRPADTRAVEAARLRQQKLAKPIGSLGKLETMSVRLAGITGKVNNDISACRVLVFAADNGVVDEGVAVTPKSVTLQQAVNMTRHKTGMSAIAHYFGDTVSVIDVGIDASAEFDGIIDRKIRNGTANIRKGSAMSREEAVRAIGAGIETVKIAAKDGVRAIGVGEMGIGNTTTSAAVLACLTGKRAEEVTGRGSGLTDEAFENKKRVINDALDRNMPDSNDPIDVLSKVGGFDIAAMAGAFIGCAKERIPAVVDGFISAVAALVAVKLCENVRDFIFLSHASREKGYMLVANALALEPCLMMNMRLGEGSGCPLAFRLLEAACAAMNDMATFEEASIDDGYLDELRSKKNIHE